MTYRNCVSLALALAAAPPAIGATKDQELPDQEMLRMMEFLREIEMIKQLDMIRDLTRVEASGAPAKYPAAKKPTPLTKKETSK